VMVSEWMTNGNINEFVRRNPDANRYELLGDVARGLIYMHGQGAVHGDLRGANALIDNNGHACISDFGLLAVTSDQQTNNLSPPIGGVLPRWMSPELLNPDFNSSDSRPTKASDCYALGMVIYEVLSGQVPFSSRSPAGIILSVLNGERPKRPHGAEDAWFMDGIWEMMELCWKAQPNDRPSIDTVLQCLQDATPP